MGHSRQFMNKKCNYDALLRQFLIIFPYYSFSSNVNCNTCSCRYDSNCRNRCNCYSYGNNNWWNGVRARNEGGQERPSFVDQGSTSSNNAGNQGFSSSSNQGSSSDAVVFA